MLNDLEGETNPMAGADEVDRYGVWMATVAVGEAMIGDVVVDSKKSRKMRRVVRLEAEKWKKGVTWGAGSQKGIVRWGAGS